MDMLNFVIYSEDGVWVAHGLEKNIVTHAESLSEIKENIEALVEGYRTLVSGDAFDRIPMARPKQWLLWRDAVKANRSLDDYLAEPVEHVDTRDSYSMELQPA